MPLTAPAHQGLIVWAKLTWPRQIDGIALCVGAATPDMTFPLGSWLALHGHMPRGLLVAVLPISLAITMILRWRAAAGIAAHVPSFGPFKPARFRCVVTRRPALLSTVASVAIGAGSHVVIDAYTHAERWGAQSVGLDETAFSAFGRAISGARVGQYLGHVLGSLLFLVLILAVSRQLPKWYDADVVARAEAVDPPRSETITFWSIVIVPLVLVPVGLSATGTNPIRSMTLFQMINVGVIATLVAGLVVASGSKASVDSLRACPTTDPEKSPTSSLH